MAGRRKQRSAQQIAEEGSFALLKELLPEHWVIHDYAPDYGIDGVVEIFEPVAGGDRWETLGESFFFQLKSARQPTFATRTVRGRMNVEKWPLTEPSPDERTAELDIIAYPLETNELVTVEAMGGGVSVLLFVAAMDRRTMHFVNLTDYIDKVLTPEDPDWREKDTKTIYVPARNEIQRETPLLKLLRLYAIRAKMMGLFAKIHFQSAELSYGLHELDSEQWRWMLKHFIEKLTLLDIWEFDGWAPLAQYRRSLGSLAARIDEGPLDEHEQIELVGFWSSLDALSRTYEEVFREVGLPTLMAQEISYP